MDEHLEEFSAGSQFLPREGWALFERPPPSRLNLEARGFLIDLFNAGKENKNHRVSPGAAEVMLRDKFPIKTECWLTVKQVAKS
jgi:hypothetical protein